MGLFGRKKKQPEAPVPSVPAEDPGELTAVISAAAIAAAENDDLPVVIAAAIAAYNANQYAPTLAVRKTNRIAGTRPVWGVMGTNEAMDTRRM